MYTCKIKNEIKETVQKQNLCLWLKKKPKKTKQNKKKNKEK